MSYSALASVSDNRVRCKLTDGDFASGLKITDVGNQSQNFVQTPLNELLLEQRNPAGVLLNTTNLTALSDKGIPVFGGVAINDPSLTGQTELTATAQGILEVTQTAGAISSVGCGEVNHGKLNLSDPTGVGTVALETSVGGGLSFVKSAPALAPAVIESGAHFINDPTSVGQASLTADVTGDLFYQAVLPAPSGPVSFKAIATNSIGPFTARPLGALIATGTLILNGGGGAQAVAVANITATSTVVVAVSQHLAAPNTANYVVSAPVAGVGFNITSTGATDVDEVVWFVYNT